MTHTYDTLPEDEESLRKLAREQVEKRRGLVAGSVAWVVVNAFLVVIWAMTGRHFFWPGFVMAGWGMGMILGWWDYRRGPIKESDIDRELRRMR